MLCWFGTLAYTWTWLGPSFAHLLELKPSLSLQRALTEGDVIVS